MNKTPSIDRLVDALPRSSITVRMLQALDFVTPGQWKNTTSFDDLLREVSGETDRQLLSRVRERALALYNDSNQGYQRAMWLYQAVDNTDQALGAAALANKVGEKIGFLSFLSRITPKADRAQQIDLGLKLITELLAFCFINGLPGDSIGDFVRALGVYEREARVRMAALVCIDGVLPLGPDFAAAVLQTMQRLGPGELEQNGTYQQIRQFIPGGGAAEHLGFLGRGFEAASGWMSALVREHGLTPDKIGRNLEQFIAGADSKLDYLAGFLDMSTNYLEHTGTQSLARSLINRALAEV